MLGVVYFILSTVAAVFCLFSAWDEYVHFYPILVYLSTNKTAMLVMGNFGFAVSLLLAKALQTLFFGNVTAEESREIIEKSKYSILETCLALTTFRLSLNFTIVCLFTALLFTKIFHWLAYMRVDICGRQRLPLTTIIRTGVPICFLFSMDMLTVMCLVYFSSQTGIIDVVVLFAFEWTILLGSMWYNSFRFMLAVVEHFLGRQLQSKYALLFVGEFSYKLATLVLYLAFIGVVTVELGTFPLHLVREIVMIILKLWTMVVKHFKYRWILKNLESQFRTVNIAEGDDRDATCTVCMADITVGKELPCGHIFHLDCLKEWFRRNPICPTCRHPIRVRNQQAAGGPANNPVPPAAAALGRFNRNLRNANVIVIQAVNRRFNQQQPAPTPVNQRRAEPVQPQANSTVLRSDGSVSTAGQLTGYTLGVQHEIELHQMYLSHLYSLQHNLLNMQSRWSQKQRDKESDDSKTGEKKTAQVQEPAGSGPSPTSRMPASRSNTASRSTTMSRPTRTTSNNSDRQPEYKNEMSRERERQRRILEKTMKNLKWREERLRKMLRERKLEPPRSGDEPSPPKGEEIKKE